MKILLCTLGQSWAVIPEVFALLDPDRCPLYRHHPAGQAIERLRREHSLQPVDELWVCTTSDSALDAGLEKLTRWLDAVGSEIPLRIWRTAEVADVADQMTGDRVRELLYRAVLLASEHIGDGGGLFLSLAGGRKTMSADLQGAGMLIGCDALLHVIAPPLDRMTPALQEARPETFTRPLSPEDCEGLIPLVIGEGQRSELLDIEVDGAPPVTSATYALTLPPDREPKHWPFTEKEKSLPLEIHRREREGSRLLGNYMHMLAREEHHENWRSLYRLPPALIEWLRKERLSKAHRIILEPLPKADLHRHIGGCLGISAQRRVGRVIWESLTKEERGKALQQVRHLLKAEEWPWDWPAHLRNEGKLKRSHYVAALLVEADDDQLRHNLYGVTEPRFALQENPRGFAAYERPGELSGSALLAHPAALEPYARELIEAALEEGLEYLELRGSPQKYRDDSESQLEFLRQLQTVADSYDDFELRFIVIADRRQETATTAAVELAVAGRERLGGFIVALDLAGDEMQDGTDAPERIATLFRPAFESCLPITVHAGEGTPPQKIWDAAYLLHADRVGHGLTLAEDSRLLQRFRDRGICVELCPTSNDEVVGFGENRPYPLREYWRQGISLAICTDNPGISRTNAVGELFKASTFWPEMTLWDTLAIVKQGFHHAFLPAREKERLLKAVDRTIYRQVVEWRKRTVESMPG